MIFRITISVLFEYCIQIACSGTDLSQSLTWDAVKLTVTVVGLTAAQIEADASAFVYLLVLPEAAPRRIPEIWTQWLPLSCTDILHCQRCCQPLCRGPTWVTCAPTNAAGWWLHQTGSFQVESTVIPSSSQVSLVKLPLPVISKSRHLCLCVKLDFYNCFNYLLNHLLLVIMCLTICPITCAYSTVLCLFADCWQIIGQLLAVFHWYFLRSYLQIMSWLLTDSSSIIGCFSRIIFLVW